MNGDTSNKKTIKNKQYIIKSVFLGKRDIKEIILKIAENKAAKEMGLI